MLPSVFSRTGLALLEPEEDAGELRVALHFVFDGGLFVRALRAGEERAPQDEGPVLPYDPHEVEAVVV